MNQPSDLNTKAQHNSSSPDSADIFHNQISIYLKKPCDGNECFVSFTYLTEGAANIIWLINFPPSSSFYNYDSTLVLRTRKDIASTIPMTQLRQQFQDRIEHLFSQHSDLLLAVHLIQIDQATIDTLNTRLHELETNGQRKEMRRGIYLPVLKDEPYAMLMPNLANGDGCLFEFKPKWLVQSPSAPFNARRCRTCALNAMRRASISSPQELGRGDSGFCPFDLVASSYDDEILTSALRHVWTDQKTLSAFVTAFKEKVQPALRHLQKLQLQENAVGLKDFQNPQGKDFSVAMALRDCSAALKVIVSNDGTVNIPQLKFLDLDFKDSGGGKVQKWARTELELINEGWYKSDTLSQQSCNFHLGRP